MNTQIEQALALLKLNKPICFPTETIYALAGSASSSVAIKNIYKIKDRSLNLPLSIMVPDIETAEKYAIFGNKALELANIYWPGPLTLILKRNPNSPHISREINNINDTIGIRIPNHQIALKILKLFNKPIVATSVNPSGKPAANSPNEIRKYFGDRVFIIDNYNDMTSNIASSVFDVTDENNIKVLRQGIIKLESLSC